MSAPGEIAPLSRLARPHVALITTIAPAHLEAFSGLDGIAREKLSIIEGLEADGIAILPRDLDAASLNVIDREMWTGQPPYVVRDGSGQCGTSRSGDDDGGGQCRRGGDQGNVRSLPDRRSGTASGLERARGDHRGLCRRRRSCIDGAGSGAMGARRRGVVSVRRWCWTPSNPSRRSS